MEKFLNKTKYLIAILLIFCLASCFLPMFSILAEGEEETLSISDILNGSEYSSQEITSSLPFNPNFEGENATEREQGWQTAGEISTGNSTISSDMTLTDEIANSGGIKYSDIGTCEGNYSMLLINTETGVSAIESINTITIPARALYLLTFKLKLTDIKNNNGFYVNLIEVNSDIKDDNLKKIQIAAIKSTVEKDENGAEEVVYVSYAFLIQGSELYDTEARLQFSLGYRSTDDDTIKNELGIAALDDIRMFTLTSEQSNRLTNSTNVTKANFSQINSNYNVNQIANGAFNNVINQGYNLSDIKLFTPADWTQTTSINNTQANWGIINTNSAMFSSKFPSLLNPGLTTWQTSGTIDNTYNNVLILNNISNTYQTISSKKIVLNKEKIYELSFEFCTPATKDAFEEENNSLTFIIKDKNNNIIYNKENIYSYNEADHAKDTATWKRLSLIIETADVSQELTFEIVFGDETQSKTGVVYIDNVRLDKRTADKAFNNIYENKLELNVDETSFLEKGYASLEDVKNLKDNSIVLTYKFTSTTITDGEDGTDTSKEDENASGANLTFLWYVIPSILLAVCTIGGIIIYYAQKIKIKPRAKKKLSNKKKVEYDKTKNVKPTKVDKVIETKQVKEKELTPKQIEENLTLEAQIEQLEDDFANKKISLKKYLKKRQQLEDKILKSKE